MPVYEYKCDTCGEVFTSFQSINDDPLVEGPDCDQDNSNQEDDLNKKPCSLKKLLFAPSIKFQGDGWTPKHYK